MNSLISKTLFLATLACLVHMVFAGEGRIDDSCYVANDCETFCCNNTGAGTVGSCVLQDEDQECVNRAHSDSIILWTTIGFFLIITFICIVLKII